MPAKEKSLCAAGADRKQGGFDGSWEKSSGSPEREVRE